MRCWAKATLAAAAAGAVLAAPTAADALFARSVSAATPLSSATLAAPTNPTISNKQCPFIFGSGSATVAWNPTSAGYATGYEVVVDPSNGSPTAYPVTGRSTASYAFPVSALVTYSVTVRTVYRNWTSDDTSPVSVKCGLFN